MPSILRHLAVVHTYYYTDPACPWSWALEPSLRKLIHEFGDQLALTYVMAGMAREFGSPTSVIAESLEAADQSGMPVDVRLWLQDPPRSSYPACIAVKAASEQGDPGPYLRRLREGLMLRRRKLDSPDGLVDEARKVGGLDLDRFRVDLSSHAILEAFGADLDRAVGVSPEHHGVGTRRVMLPSLEFRAPDGTVSGVYGYADDYDALKRAARAAGAGQTQTAPPSIEQALRRFGSMATAEIAKVCELPGPRAPAELWRLAAEWRVRPDRVGSGELWTLA
jgi:putative protein-disulfide isomerase